MDINELVIPKGNVEEIVERLNGCRALLDALYEIADATAISSDAVSGIRDLLGCICGDFQADIDCAEREAERREATA